MRWLSRFFSGFVFGAGFLVGLGIIAGLVLWSRSPAPVAGRPQAPGAQRQSQAPANSAAETQARTGFDPLSTAEQERAASLARGAPALAALLKAAPRTEPLLVERHEESKAVYSRGAWPRRADVYIYDYGKDALIHAVVNLTTGATDAVETLRDVQLPPTTAEAARAVQLALADQRAGAAIRAQYRQLTGAQLARPEQIVGRAGVFRADSRPDAAVGAAASCGVHRCVHLFLSTADGRPLTALPIVDLSSRRLVTLSK